MKARAAEDGLKVDSIAPIAEDPSEDLANDDSEFEASKVPAWPDIAALAYHLWENGVAHKVRPTMIGTKPSAGSKTPPPESNVH
jgi:hypothetical protein